MLKKIESKIEEIISKSQIPEDPIHSDNTKLEELFRKIVLKRKY